MLTVLDEYTRQCLLIHPARSITSGQVLDTLQRLADLKGAPAFIRSDNGSVFIAHIIQDWCFTAKVQTLYIEPGSPWQNGFIESFDSRFRDDAFRFVHQRADDKALTARFNFLADEPISNIPPPREFKSMLSINVTFVRVWWEFSKIIPPAVQSPDPP